ncbi:MAG: hypothetical protein PUD72_02275 [Oscillospiraceae bacterium]|nr:hypothetical protein [Oscillospiraceae bacterium]
MNKIAILDVDMIFISRLQMAMNNAYPNNYEFIFFSSAKKLRSALGKMDFDLLLINYEYIDNLNTIPKQVKTIILTESRSCVLESGEPTICKYQSVEEWHRFLCDFCALDMPLHESGNAYSMLTGGKLCLFTSASGGVGASSAAAAFCLHATSRGLSTVYLNVESIPSTSCFFKSNSYFDFGDVICALRSNKIDLDKTIEKSLVLDDTGVFFISPSKQCGGQQSISGEDVIKICDGIQRVKHFDLIVIDLNFVNASNIVLPFVNSSQTVIVSNGEKIVNEKTEKLFSILSSSCEMSMDAVCRKSSILYNRFVPGISELLTSNSYSKLGGINQMDFSEIHSSIVDISKLYPFERLLEMLNV